MNNKILATILVLVAIFGIGLAITTSNTTWATQYSSWVSNLKI